MPYFHVRLTVPGQRHDEVKNDLDADTLERQFLAPYRAGSPVTVNGKTIPIDAIERIRVTATEVPSAQIISQLRAEDASSSVFFAGGPGYDWRAASRGSDVTDQFITGPPGSAAEQQRDEIIEGASSSVGDVGSVFIIAGRDFQAVYAITALLRAVGLRVVEWEHAVARTGLPNPYVGDVVDVGLRMARAAIVLLTPDDLVQLREDLIRDEDGPDERETRGQARPNVYYEAGIADTLGRERTIIVEIGNVKSFSDAAGRHVVRYDGSPGKRHALVERLRVAGLAVDASGQEWLNVGDMSAVLDSTARQPAGVMAGSVVDKAEAVGRIDELLERHAEMRTRSQHDDLSDLPSESLELAFRAQALVDRLGLGTSYAGEAEAARSQPAHVRVAMLTALLRALRAELRH